MRVCLFTIALSCLHSESHAQLSRIHFEHTRLEDGLSQSTVHAILQDSRGFMWFGTQDGLNRYDGYEIAVYGHDPEDPASLPHNYVRALAEDPQGNIWIATEGGGVAMWDWRSDAFVVYRSVTSPGSLSSDRVSSITLGGDGVIWIGTLDAGLNRLDPTTGRVVAHRHDPASPGSLEDDRIGALHVDGGGTLWVGTHAGLSRFDQTSDQFVPIGERTAGAPSRADRVRSIAEDSSGTLWVGTYGGLVRLDRATGTLHPYRHVPTDPSSLAGSRVYAILEDLDGTLWIGTNGGLNRFDPRNGTFAGYQNDAADPTSLGHDVVMSLYQDRGGVIWVGTQGAGLSRWNPTTASFRHFRTDPRAASTLSSDVITSFVQDPGGRLWVGTFGGGLNRLDRETGEYTVYRADPSDPASLNDDRVMSLAYDAEGFLWAGTMEGGLNRLDPATGRFQSFKNEPGNEASISGNGIMSLFVDHRGDVWVGTYGGGLNRFDRASETFERFQHDPADATSISGNIVTSIAEDPSARLWLGTERNGINRFDRASATFAAYRNDPSRPTSLSSDSVLSLHVSNGMLWIGTQGGGLNGLDVEQAVAPAGAAFRHVTRRNGLANDVVHGISSDDAGNLWLSTNNGLSRFDPLGTTSKNYDVSHGLQSNEFNTGAHYRSPQGEIFVGGFNGFNVFHPERIAANTHVPPLVITSFLKFNKPAVLEQPLSEIGEIELGYRDSVVSFEFAALDYAAPAENRYAYKLEGFEDEWIELDRVRRVTFTNLDAGSYVLRIRGANNDGLWNNDGVALSIAVAPPPWATWWAYSLYALLVTYGVVAYLKAQRDKLRREEKRARELEIVVEERTHQLAEQMTRYQDLYDNAPDMFATIDAKTGTIVQCNRTLQEGLGRSEEEILGRHIAEIHAADCSDSLEGVLAELRREHDSHNAELLLETADGSVIDASLNVSAVSPDAESNGYGRLVWRDITIRKRLEQELRQAQKLKAIGRLAGGVAHEFNNLMAGIGGLAHLLLSKAEDERSKKSLGQILTCTDRAADLTSQLLGFGRGQPHKPVSLDFTDHLRETASSLSSVVRPGVEINVNAPDGVTLVSADPRQIDQILTCMASNASDAMPDGGVITIDATRETVDEDDEMAAGEYLVLSVSDDGEGMAPETLERVFEPFFTTKEQGQGTGLGLSMVYGIVRQHGGHIRVESRVDVGTRFDVYLPVRQEEADGAATVSSESDGASTTILVVDDDATVLMVLEELLSQAGYTPLVVDHPEKAERLIEERGDEVKLLLTDVVMPGYSGPELTERVLAKRPLLPVLFMSGYAAERIRDHGLLPPDATYIAKPFAHEDLLRKIAEALRTRPSEDERPAAA